MTSLNPVRTIGSQIAEVIIKHQKLSKKEAKEKAIDLMKRVGITNPEKRFGITHISIQGECVNELLLRLRLLVNQKF